MLDLITGGHGTLAMIGLAIVGTLAALWKVYKTGRAAERGRATRNAKKGWADANELLGRAQRARRAASRGADTDLLSDDGHKRPKS